MGNGRGNQKPPDEPSQADDELPIEDDTSGRLPALPDLMRRALSMGLSGFFLTEEAVRKAVGDTLPKDWIDFAVDQSDRTRQEFLERLSFEIGRALESTDLSAVLRELLEGRTLEVKAEIRLRGSDDAGSESGVEVDTAVQRKRG